MTTIVHDRTMVWHKVYARRDSYAYRDSLLEPETCEAYICGDIQPHYPVPATELDNALAMPYEYVMPVLKAMLTGRLI